jgi:hypothetical protein
MQPIRKSFNPIWGSIIALGIFACRPMLAISWNEFLIISGLIAVLLGPWLYGLIRRVEQFRNREKKDN